MGLRRFLMSFAAICVALPTASAQASTLSEQGSAVKFQAATGELNSVTIDLVNGATAYRLRDRGANQITVAGTSSCTVAGSIAVCPADTSFEVDLGDRNDRAKLKAHSSSASGADSILGGAGKDNIRTAVGDTLLDGGLDADVMVGGITDYSSRTTPIVVTPWGSRNDGADGEGDTVKRSHGLLGGAGSDELWGGDYDDRIVGGAGDDELRGGAGDDTIDGGSGVDLFDGGLDDDSLLGRDGVADQVFWCGAGTDEVLADLSDPIAAPDNACETVDKS